MHPAFVPLIIAGGLAALAAFWSGIVWLIAQLGGWGRLARHFATDAPPAPEARSFSMASGAVGMSRYNGALRVHVQPDGLRLSVLLPFRPGHPPVLIPWAEIASVERKTRFAISTYEVAVGDPEVATLTLPESVIEAMRDVLPTAVEAE